MPKLHLFRSTGVVSTACPKGDLGNWGRSRTDGGRASDVIARVAVRLEDGEGRKTDEAG
jgi:hypothetical protein